jgi:hypothetical protein
MLQNTRKANRIHKELNTSISSSKEENVDPTQKLGMILPEVLKLLENV